VHGKPGGLILVEKITSQQDRINIIGTGQLEGFLKGIKRIIASDRILFIIAQMIISGCIGQCKSRGQIKCACTDEDLHQRDGGTGAKTVKDAPFLTLGVQNMDAFCGRVRSVFNLALVAFHCPPLKELENKVEHGYVYHVVLL
jgi:hypothetical protein